jgi:hypothetical protein
VTTTTPPLFGLERDTLTRDDYYTPRWVFDTMGLTFDLDPCSPPGGVPWVPAARYFTKADDGLARDWFGRVWLNPPFSRPGPWVDRFLWHRSGVALLPTSNGAWWRRVWRHADAMTIWTSPQFVNGVGGGLPVPCFFVALGPECVEAVGRLGRAR